METRPRLPRPPPSTTTTTTYPQTSKTGGTTTATTITDQPTATSPGDSATTFYRYDYKCHNQTNASTVFATTSELALCKTSKLTMPIRNQMPKLAPSSGNLQETCPAVTPSPQRLARQASKEATSAPLRHRHPRVVTRAPGKTSMVTSWHPAREPRWHPMLLHMSSHNPRA